MRALRIFLFLAVALLGIGPTARAQGTVPPMVCFCAFTASPNDPGCARSIEIPVTGTDAGQMSMAKTKCEEFCTQKGKKLCKLEQLIPEPTTKVDSDCPPDAKSGARCLSNPLGIKTFPELIGRIVNTALGVVGSFALLFFIYGGLLWLTSGGSADKIGKGKDAMKWAALGILLIFASYALVRFVLGAFTAL
jgi:hypothetical protein